MISPWLFNVYMDGVVREVTASVLWKGLELLARSSSRTLHYLNGGTFEIIR